MDEKESKEDLIKRLTTPPKCVAVRFLDEESRILGAKVILTQTTEGVGLARGIHILPEKDLQYLDEAFGAAGLKYEKYFPKSNCASEIYQHFGIERPKRK